MSGFTDEDLVIATIRQRKAVVKGDLKSVAKDILATPITEWPPEILKTTDPKGYRVELITRKMRAYSKANGDCFKPRKSAANAA